MDVESSTRFFTFVTLIKGLFARRRASYARDGASRATRDATEIAGKRWGVSTSPSCRIASRSHACASRVNAPRARCRPGMESARGPTCRSRSGARNRTGGGGSRWPEMHGVPPSVREGEEASPNPRASSSDDSSSLPNTRRTRAAASLFRDILRRARALARGLCGPRARDVRRGSAETLTTTSGENSFRFAATILHARCV